MEEQGKAAGHVIRGFNPADLFGKGFSLGCADLIQGGSFREALGRCVVSLLLHAVDGGGRRIFTKATIVLPPATATTYTEETVFSALAQATTELRGFALDEEEAPILRRLVNVVHSPSLEVASLMRVVEQQGQRCLISVADASKYRDLSLDLPVAIGLSAARVAEDRWAPHVTSLCRQLVAVVKHADSYGLVHVPDIPARQAANIEQLQSVDDCFVSTLRYEADPEEVFNASAQSWLSMLLQGRQQEVTKQLDELKLPEGARLHALAQLFQRAGRNAETLSVIAQLRPHLQSLHVAATVQVARLAHQAGDDDLADELLPHNPDGIGEQVWLEEGLELATHLEDNVRIASFDARLAELLPHSERLRENRDRRLLMNCQEAKHGELHRFTASGFTDHHLTLLERLSAFEPEYEAAIEEAKTWGQDWLELAVVCCAMHARSVGKPRDAANVACLIASSELYGRQATQVVLWSVRSMMLKELVPKEEHDYYRQLLQTVFRFLARHSEDSGVRTGLTSLLSAESCGDLGIPLVAATMLDLAQQGARFKSNTKASASNRAVNMDAAVQSSLESAMHWLGELGGGEPGVTVIPRELLIADPDDVVRLVGRLIHAASGQEGEDVDLTFMKQLVLLACAICPHAKLERDEDIRLLRVLASHFAVEGQLQQARDYAEQILLLGQTSVYRHRLAWQAVGDIYHRCRNPIVALVSLACALAVDVDVEKADVWHEVYAIHRVLRDLELYELSRAFLPTMRTLLSDLGFDAEKDPRYLSAELSLRLMETDDNAAQTLHEILAEVFEVCRNELGDRNRLLPMAVLLGQTVLKAEGAGVDISPEVRGTLATALAQVGTSMAEMVRTISTPKPAAADVLAMFNSVERAAYASDVARDYALVGLAAQRLLDSSAEGSPTPTESAFAVELVADHTVAPLSDTPAMDVEWPSQYALELNMAGLDVAFMAVDSEGELVVTQVSGGQMRTVAQPKHGQSFQHRFSAWLEDFPKDYGRIDRSQGNNIFYLTMEKLDVRLPMSERLVVVAEPFLQQLTANLVLVQPEDGGFSYFAGKKAAIGVVPSLSWLFAARNAPRGGRTAYKAWISAAPRTGFGEAMDATSDAGREELGREPTLDIALSRLSGCFEDFGFIVDNGRRLPRDMKDAGLAVVTAHGGLNSEGRYLHSIRDDDDLVEAPSSLAIALAGIELVILFVCSGGRIDKSPWDNSTVSLPKQLLNRGTRAVIASPWPLDVMVTYNWLERFLKEWENGATALDATKTANDAVSQHLGDVPQYSLAMRVYGDVLLSRPVVGLGVSTGPT